jgi:hypothetical protein
VINSINIIEKLKNNILNMLQIQENFSKHSTNKIFSNFLKHHKNQTTTLQLQNKEWKSSKATSESEKRLQNIMETIFFEEWFLSIFPHANIDFKNPYPVETSLFLHRLASKIIEFKLFKTFNEETFSDFLKEEEQLQLPNYNSVRKEFGLKTLKTFSELTDKKQTKLLEQIYGKQGIDKLGVSHGLFFESFVNPNDTLTRVSFLLPFKRSNVAKESKISVNQFKSKIFEIKDIKQHSTNPFEDSFNYARSQILHPRMKIYWIYNDTHVIFEVQALGLKF